MRFSLPICAALALAACQPAVPESGVGFGDYQSYLKAREGQLAGSTVSSAPTVQNAGAAIGAETVTATPLGATSTAALPVAPIAAPVVAPVAGAPIQTSAALATPLATPASTSTASSAAVVAAPAAMPASDPSAPLPASILAAIPGAAPAATPAAPVAAPVAAPSTAPVSASSTNPDGSPNLVVYALNAPNRLGQPVYARSGDSAASTKACGRYRSADLAQTAFLDQGGPQTDRKNLDPDGDGFACKWDPTPFQKAREQ